MVYYGTGEILVVEIFEFVQRAKDAGVDIRLHTVPEGQHSFIMGAGRVPEADEAIEQMGRWVRSRPPDRAARDADRLWCQRRVGRIHVIKSFREQQDSVT
jgi:hypothetical protein